MLKKLTNRARQAVKGRMEINRLQRTFGFGPWSRRLLNTLTKEEQMLRKLMNRARQAVKERIEINLDGFELGLSPEEVIADLDFGVGPIEETARLVQEDRPEVGKAA